jgi:deferrochelatase/peroxidase EfeB
MHDGDRAQPSRRLFLGASAGTLAAVCPFAAQASGGRASAPPAADRGAPIGQACEPFYGSHQGGIVTPTQAHTYFAAFDVLDTHDAGLQSGYGAAAGPAKPVTRADLSALMRRWTEAAARMTQGKTASDQPADLTAQPADSGDAIGLAPARLTLTFGFGGGLFARDGRDRFGLAARRPAALVDLPNFHGDQLVPQRTGGDLSVQACADDPQVAFHAVRQLARLGQGLVQLRWAQTGFSSGGGTKNTPRNLMGFKDGTQNPRFEPKNDEFGSIVWVGDEGPDWMRGGTYMVTRRIRIALEHWDRTNVDFQQQVIGRRKDDGAPLGAKREFDALDLDAVDHDGNSIIPDNAHVRLASAAVSGTQILRRGYSYNDGASFVAERWPPWRQGIEYDAGLLFVCYQKDPRTGFIKMFRTMSVIDALNQYVTHTGGGLFACPGGVQPGSTIGAGLFDA